MKWISLRKEVKATLQAELAAVVLETEAAEEQHGRLQRSLLCYEEAKDSKKSLKIIEKQLLSSF